jgi:gliding motility-associated-like protein
VEVTSVGVNAGIIGKDTLFYGESTTVQAITTGNGTMFTYEWSPSDGLSDPYSATTEAAPEADVIYTVTVTSASGCTATDEVEVFYRGSLCEEPFIFVPKAFTPNNDSNNDFFIIRGVNIVELEFVVWSRWGEKVYQTTDVNAQGWDGTYKGAELTPDSYAWYARVRCGNGAVYENKGDVTLLK